MKKLVLSISALCLLIFGAQSLAPREAKAVLLVEMAANQQPVLNVPEVVLCIIALPICLLDEKSAPPTAYSEQDLLDNGYSASQVAAISSDESAIMANLQSRHLTMEIEKSETYDSLAAGLRSIDPAVSADYIRFVADLNHIAVPNQ